jgi:hypothetical protein
VLPVFLLSLLLFAACDSNDMSMDATVNFGADTYQVSESGDPLDVEVVLGQAAPQEVTIPLTLGGTAIAGEDYETSGDDEVVISEGSTTGTFTITPIDNATIDQARTIELLIDASEVEGFAGGETPSAEVTITDDEMAGSYTASFEQGSYETNEYEQDTLDVIVEINQTAPVDLTLDFTTGGDATTPEDYELLSDAIEIPAGETADTVQVAIKDTRSYGESKTLTLALQTPDNEAISIGGTTEAEITIVNPVADVATFAPNEDFARLYAYNTWSDVAVPETGRQNSDPTAGTFFDESFAFTLVPSRSDATADPNVFGFGSPLWSEENFTRNTNILNMVEIYDDGEEPNTVAEGVSSASAGLYYPSFFRLTPDGPNATTGTVTLIPDEIEVYRPDQTDDGVTNPESFIIGISSEGGVYDETEGTINITITFDETAVDNGTQTRRYEFSADRRASTN